MEVTTELIQMMVDQEVLVAVRMELTLLRERVAQETHLLSVLLKDKMEDLMVLVELGLEVEAAVQRQQVEQQVELASLLIMVEMVEMEQRHLYQDHL